LILAVTISVYLIIAVIIATLTVGG
jgi:hypothetical protein